MKKIVLTGGGSAGHVAPNLALVPSLRATGYEVHYIGSHTGIERDLVEAEGIPYYGISSGKLRRYMSIKNISDIFRVCKGLADAVKVLRKIRPDIVFSKGGFVVVPVVAAARLLKIKTIIHESDMTPGLANKLAMPFATKVCVSFPETMEHVPKGKGTHTGTPLRAELFAGNRAKGVALFNETAYDTRPILLVTGGSQGAEAINRAVREALPQILERFRVIHLCGKGNLSGITLPSYVEIEYGDMPDIYAAADIVISRAGANTIFELLALGKPNVLIPLPREQSRGDQLLNAATLERKGFSVVLPERELTPQRLLQDICMLYEKREIFCRKMKSHDMGDGVRNVMGVIN